MKPRLLLSKDKFKIDINNPMYWTPAKILSYNFYLATVEGGRGIGKTTNMLGYVLNDYCNNGSKFVYIRRYKPEIKQFVDPSKAPLNVIVDGIKYVGDKNGGYTCMYGDDAIGYAIPLSTSKSYKSSKFKNVKWIVAPDYSLFGDFPNALQIFNVYRSKICFCWLASNTEAKIIPNVRWSFPFTFEYCFDGIVKGSNVAIGIMGLIKRNDNRAMFLEGFRRMVDTIKPKSILVYGFLTEANIEELLGYAMNKGIRVIAPHSKIDRYKGEDAVYGIR